MQLVGHLRGRALQELKLLEPKDKVTYGTAVKVLRERLDPGNQLIAALDFRHAMQSKVRRDSFRFHTAIGEVIPNSSWTRKFIL